MADQRLKPNLVPFDGLGFYGCSPISPIEETKRNIYRFFFPRSAFAASATGFIHFASEGREQALGIAYRRLFELIISSVDVWIERAKRMAAFDFGDDEDDEDDEDGEEMDAGSDRGRKRRRGRGGGRGGGGGRGRSKRRSREMDDDINDDASTPGGSGGGGGGGGGRAENAKMSLKDPHQGLCAALNIDGDPDKPRFRFFVTLVTGNSSSDDVKTLFGAENVRGFILTLVIDDNQITLSDLLANRIRYADVQRIQQEYGKKIRHIEQFGMDVAHLHAYNMLRNVYINMRIGSLEHRDYPAIANITANHVDTTPFNDNDYLLHLLRRVNVGGPEDHHERAQYADDCTDAAFLPGPEHLTWTVYQRHYRVVDFYKTLFPWMSALQRLPPGVTVTVDNLRDGDIPEDPNEQMAMLASMGLARHAPKRVDAFEEIRMQVHKSDIIPDTLALCGKIPSEQYKKRLETMQRDILARTLPAFDLSADIPNSMKAVLRWFNCDRNKKTVSHINRGIYATHLSPFANMMVQLNEGVHTHLNTVNGNILALDMFAASLQMALRAAGLRISIEVPGSAGIGKSHAAETCMMMLIDGTYECLQAASPMSWTTGDPIADDCRIVFIEETLRCMIFPYEKLSTADQQAVLLIQSILTRGKFETTRSVQAEITTPDGRVINTWVRSVQSGNLRMVIITTGNLPTQNAALQSRLFRINPALNGMSSKSANTVVDSIADGELTREEQIFRHNKKIVNFVEMTRTMHALVSFAFTLMHVGCLPYPPKRLLDFYIRIQRSYLEAQGIPASQTRNVGRTYAHYLIYVIQYAVHMEFFSEQSPHRRIAKDANGNYKRTPNGDFEIETDEFHMSHLLNLKNWFVDNEEVAIMAITKNFSSYVMTENFMMMRNLLAYCGNFDVNQVTRMVHYVNRMSMLLRLTHAIPTKSYTGGDEQEMQYRNVQLNRLIPTARYSVYYIGPCRNAPEPLQILPNPLAVRSASASPRHSNSPGSSPQYPAESSSAAALRTPSVRGSRMFGNGGMVRFNRLARHPSRSVWFMGKSYHWDEIDAELRDAVPAKPYMPPMPEFRTITHDNITLVDINYVKIGDTIDAAYDRVANELNRKKSSNIAASDVRTIMGSIGSINVPAIPYLPHKPSSWEEYALHLEPSVLTMCPTRLMPILIYDNAVPYMCIHAAFLDETKLLTGFLKQLEFVHTNPRTVLLGTTHAKMNSLFDVYEMQPNPSVPVLQSVHATQLTETVAEVLDASLDGADGIYEANRTGDQNIVIDHSPEEWAAARFMEEWCIPAKYLPSEVKKRTDAIYNDPTNPWTIRRGRVVHKAKYPDDLIGLHETIQKQREQETERIAAMQQNDELQPILLDQEDLPD